jgi:methyl-accepting chemotaxis protein
MKLGSKLLAAPLFTAIAVLAVAAFNTVLAGREAASNEAMFKARLNEVSTLADAQDGLGSLHAGAYRTVAVIASLDDAQVKAFRARLASELQTVKKTFNGVASTENADPALVDSVKQATTAIDTYLKQADAAIDMASVDANTGVAAMQSADATYASLAKITSGMVARMHAHASEAMDASLVRTNRNNLALGALALLVAGVVVALAAVMQRKLVAELKRAALCSDAVASGNLQVDTRSARSDEVGDLMRSLGRMTGQLNATLGEVLRASDSIGTASSEIASGNQDLSHRTEQTAGNLQQAASSMEQLTGAVRQSADSAR